MTDTSITVTQSPSVTIGNSFSKATLSGEIIITYVWHVAGLDHVDMSNFFK